MNKYAKPSALTAAPIVRKPLDSIGAPGLTDFVRIYIASELNKREYRTTLRHEQAHVWAAHNARGQALRKRDPEARIDLWKIACEMEIARNIYDVEDVDTIKHTRSRLKGGYVADSFPAMPADVLTAEAIYAWLLEHPEEHPQQTISICVCACGCGDGEGDGQEDAEGEDGDKGDKGDNGDTQAPSAQDTAGTLQAIRAVLDATERAAATSAQQRAAYKAVRMRPPTLTSVLDAGLRVRVERERSFRRPARRGEEADFIMRGKLSQPRPPLVEVFVDRSGSFSPEKTARAEERLRDFLRRYSLSVRADVWYFGDGRLLQNDVIEGGNTPYDLILQHIRLSRPKIAIVITDDDGVPEGIGDAPKETTFVCVPIGCQATQLAGAVGGMDVAGAV